MVDPVLGDPNLSLISGKGTVTSSQLLSVPNAGRLVDGIAADGITQILIRVSSLSSSEKFRLTLFGDASDTQASTLPDEDGALGNPSDTVITANQVTVTSSVNIGGAGQKTYAFAVYRAPVDFARPSGAGYKSGSCSGSPIPDNQQYCRVVTIVVEDVTTGTAHPISTLHVSILRPPVVLLHGLWSNSSETWNKFKPLVTGADSSDSKFYVARIDYSARVPNVTATDPSLSADDMAHIKANSVGLQYSASAVADKINVHLWDFKKGKNPGGIAVAAVQVDVIGHSLGGLMARHLVLNNFLSSSNLSSGYIHKLITIDSPHFGSPLAAQLLDAPNSCVRQILANQSDYSLKTVSFSNGDMKSGAVGDLQGMGTTADPLVDSSLSNELQSLAKAGVRPLPAALVAGTYTDWAALDRVGVASYIRNKCKNDPLAKSLNSNDWPLLFGQPPNNQNDGIVGILSQQNGQTISSLMFPGIAHSSGITGRSAFGFSDPSATSASPLNPIADQVIVLLNTPVTKPPFSQTSLNP